MKMRRFTEQKAANSPNISAGILILTGSAQIEFESGVEYLWLWILSAFINTIILGGVSLADDYPSLFAMTSAGNVLISGGDYKIEGRIIALVINILFGLFFWLRLRNKNSMDDSKTIY